MAISFPSNPNTNDTHTVNGRTWVWDGATWKLSGTINNGISLEVSDTAPATPIEGDMWYDSSSGSTFTYYDSVWVELGNTASVVSFIADADGDTRVHVEESVDEDTIRFDTAGVERLTITSAGHVLPSADVTYDLGSSSNRFRDLYLSGSSIDLGGVTISSDGTSLSMPPISSVSGDFTVDTLTLHVDSTNNRVGIGTSSPAAYLHVFADLDAEGIRLQYNDGDVQEGAYQSFYDYAGTRIGYVGYPGTGNMSLRNETSSGTLSLDTNSTQRLTINSSGNVGIGTTSPSQTLDVRSANDNTSVFQHTTNGSDARIELRAPESGGTSRAGQVFFDPDANFVGFRNGNINAMGVDSSGNVGIGTTAPRGVFDVQNQGNVYLIHSTTQQGTVNTYLGGHLFFSPWDTTDDVYLQARRGNDTGNTNMWFRTTNASSGIINAMKIDASGRVGIGQPSPTYNFHAKGPEDIASAVEISSGNTAYRYHMRFLRNGGLLSNGIFSDTGATYFGNASDARLKTGVESIVTSDALTALNNLRPVEYRYLLDSEDTVRTGFIAQEVEEVLPEAVKRVGGGHLATQFVIDDNGEPQYLGVDANGDTLIQEEPDLLLTWEPITTTLVAAVQELSSLVSSLTARIEALESANP